MIIIYEEGDEGNSKLDSKYSLEAHLRLKEEIERAYSTGWFVGIVEERVVGAAATFAELETLLRGQGLDPRTVLIAEVGVNYPEYETIFLC